MNDEEKIIGLGYGKPSQILARLPEGTRTIIRDDEAAEAGASDCWFASPLPPEEAQEIYIGLLRESVRLFRANLPEELAEQLDEVDLDGAVYTPEELKEDAQLDEYF